MGNGSGITGKGGLATSFYIEAARRAGGRPAVVNRKVWGRNRTVAGAQAVLTSVLETCRRQAESAVDFVSQTLRWFGNPILPRPMLLGTR